MIDLEWMMGVIGSVGVIETNVNRLYGKRKFCF